MAGLGSGGRRSAALESSIGRLALLAVPALAVAALVLVLALDSGAYSLTSRNALAIAVWWTVALAAALSLFPRRQPTPAALATAGLLAALAALSGLSIAWADSAEKAFAELDRTALYLGVFVLAALGATAGNLRSLGTGFGIGLAATGLLALASRLFGGLVDEGAFLEFLPGVEARLSYPVDYWNGLAILVALAFPLLLGAASGPARPLARGLAVAPLPALAATIYLTSSRGGAAVVIAGVAFLVALTNRRLAALGATAIAAAGALATVATLQARPELVDGPLGTAAAESQGESAALLIALACLATGAVYALACARLSPPVFSLSARAKRQVALAASVFLVAAVVAADPAERLDTFRQAPEQTDAQLVEEGYTEAHLLSGGGSGRWQFWSSAVDEFESRPLAGRGAGSWESWWAATGDLSYFVRDAHSLYLETLGELGLLGFALLLALMVSAAWVAVAATRRVPPASRPIAAGLAAAFFAYALALGIDWMWELTVVSVVGWGCLGLLAGAGRQEASDSRKDPLRNSAVRWAVVATGALLIVAQAIPLLAQTNIEDSQAAAAGNGDSALEHALSARRLQPWASSPHLQLALVQEQAGNLSSARAAIADAIERDRSDWRLWLVQARLETKDGAIRRARASLARARALNPRSPLFAS